MLTIAIIGAGLSGLTLARHLKHHASVTLFEKSRGVSGRLSTRRAAPYHFDHGAPAFTINTSEFKTFISPLIQKGIVQPWQGRFVELKKNGLISKRTESQAIHYVGVPSMSAICKSLSSDLKINLGIRVNEIKKEGDQWSLIDEDQHSLGHFDWVICTAPAQQCTTLLPQSLSFYDQVKAIKLTPCVTGIFGFKTPLTLDFDMAHIQDHDIDLISVNSSKPGRPQNYCVVAQAYSEWAGVHIDDDKAELMHHFKELLSECLMQDITQASHQAIHVWRYAKISKQSGPTHFIDREETIAACGDWCIESSVESAFTSGYALSQALLSHLS